MGLYKANDLKWSVSEISYLTATYKTRKEKGILLQSGCILHLKSAQTRKILHIILPGQFFHVATFICMK